MSEYLPGARSKGIKPIDFVTPYLKRIQDRNGGHDTLGALEVNIGAENGKQKATFKGLLNVKMEKDGTFAMIGKGDTKDSDQDYIYSGTISVHSTGSKEFNACKSSETLEALAKAK